MRPETDRWGLVIVRMLVGAIFIAHGSPKLLAARRNPSLPDFAASLHRIGLNPGLFWAWAVTIVESFGGVCLFLGVFTRAAAALIGAEMIVAGLKVNGLRGFYWTHGGWEVPLVFAVLCAVLVLTTPGRRSAGQARR
ncbi:MAG TPA: DoxX family protein [bacterium]|nr:DoxX family protein [bacterium]